MSIFYTLCVTRCDLFFFSFVCVFISGLSYAFYIPVLSRIGLMAVVSAHYNEQIIIIILSLDTKFTTNFHIIQDLLTLIHSLHLQQRGGDIRHFSRYCSHLHMRVQSNHGTIYAATKYICQTVESAQCGNGSARNKLQFTQFTPATTLHTRTETSVESSSHHVQNTVLWAVTGGFTFTLWEKIVVPFLEADDKQVLLKLH